MSEEQNKALDAWQISARYWDKYRALIAQIFAPLTSGLVEEARIAIRPGRARHRGWRR